MVDYRHTALHQVQALHKKRKTLNAPANQRRLHSPRGLQGQDCKTSLVANVAEALNSSSMANELIVKGCRKFLVPVKPETPIERLDAFVTALNDLTGGLEALIGRVFKCEFERDYDVLAILIGRIDALIGRFKGLAKL